MAAANRNPFSLLEDDEGDDFPAAKYAADKSPAAPAAGQKSAPKKQVAPQQPHQQISSPATAKLPSKPLPPAEAVRAEKESQGRGRGYGRRGRGGDSFGGGRGGFRDSGEGEFQRSYEGGGRGRGRRGGFNRSFDGDDKRKENEAPSEEEVKPAEAKEEGEQKKPEAPEDKEMTLDEYEKIMQEKRKNLGQQKAGERRVEADNELKKMQIMDKKSDTDVFIKLGSDKEKLKKKDSSEKEKKVININEFLKPAEGFSPRGGRSGRGRGIPGGRFASAAAAAASAPASDDSGGSQSPSNIDSPQEFPQLGKKK